MRVFDFWLPLIVPLISMVVGVIIFFLREEQRSLRTFLNIAGAVVKVILVHFMVLGVYQNRFYEFRLPMFGDVEFVLHADPLSLLFAALSSVLWLVTTIYAIGYLEDSPNRSRFFGFFSFCVSATTGIALAGNLITFIIWYELLTLSTYPLVIHRGTTDALQAGRTYLAYTLLGGALVLVAFVWLNSLAGPVDFAERGSLAHVADQYQLQLKIIFGLLIAGLGVKAAMVPLHGWLPSAMVAPAPVSALLHAVAVVKAGAFGLVRVVYDLYGLELCGQLSVMPFLAVLATVTIIYGSLRALFQDDLKRRLAFSTVSQVSYIALGISILGPIATTGGIVHLVHQGLMKITLFFCAGNYAEKLHIHRVSEMDGVGRRMPWTTLSFTLAALGMIGVPPMAGFVSKWYLGSGFVEAGQSWVILVLVASSLLNGAYFLPILYRAWFAQTDDKDTTAISWRLSEIHPGLLWPPLITCLLALLAGLFAGSPASPLFWAEVITAREYGL
ncbi:MAG: proton-conducting transporter membrane subunit [Desulfocapsaceae bacterium]|nr:proton-conducting transporter membrane subunit [Desulfocapsaceae bacterium]